MDKEKRKEYNKRYREKHREEIKAYKRRYERENKDKKYEMDKRYRLKYKDKVAEKKKEYYEANKDKIAEYKKEHRRNNIDKIQTYRKKYYAENRDDAIRKVKEYVANNREKNNNYRREYHCNNPQARIAHNLRTRINAVLKKRSIGGRLHLLVGCSMGELRKHIESTFDNGMDWGNYGRGMGKWSIDHTIPLEAFNLEDTEQQIKAFNWSNMRAMWYVENSAKSSRYNGKLYKKRSNGL